MANHSRQSATVPPSYSNLMHTGDTVIHAIVSEARTLLSRINWYWLKCGSFSNYCRSSTVLNGWPARGWRSFFQSIDHKCLPLIDRLEFQQLIFDLVFGQHQDGEVNHKSSSHILQGNGQSLSFLNCVVLESLSTHAWCNTLFDSQCYNHKHRCYH